MVLQLFALAFVLGIAFIQSVYGFFSGIIMCFSSIIAAAVALGCFEALNDIAVDYVHPNYAAAGSLMVLFAVTVVILRTLADNLVRGNVRVPSYVDWAGGGLLGLITAQISVGIVVIALQMLPMGDRVLGYTRYERREGDIEQGRQAFTKTNLWLNSDGFTVGLVSMLSNGALSTDTPLTDVYPDFAEWVSWTANTVQSESDNAVARDKTGDGFKNGVRVVKWWEQTKALEARYRNEAPSKMNKVGKYVAQNYPLQGGNKLIGVKVELTRASGDRDDRGNPSQRFRPSMLRLVGKRGGTVMHYTPRVMGGVDPELGDKLRIMDHDSNIVLRTKQGDKEEVLGEGTVDAYFDVDADFTPMFIEYKRFARAEMGVAAKPGKEGAAAGGKDTAAATPAKPTAAQVAEGNTRFIELVDLTASGDYDKLPVELSPEKARSAGENPSVEGVMFASGRIFGIVDDLKPTNPDAKVEKFKVPEGKRLCQVRVQARKANSIFGQVFNYAARTLNQYKANDDLGNPYNLAGYYAVVKRGDQKYVEIFFVGEDDTLTGSYNHMMDFKEIKAQELSADEDAVIGLLFLVEPGRTIVEIKNQKDAGVSGLNLQMQK